MTKGAQYTTISVDVDIVFVVTGPDPNYIIYDREEGRTFCSHMLGRTEETTKTFTFEYGLSYDFEGGRLKNIDETKFDISNPSEGFVVHMEADGSYW